MVRGIWPLATPQVCGGMCNRSGWLWRIGSRSCCGANFQLPNDSPDKASGVSLGCESSPGDNHDDEARYHDIVVNLDDVASRLIKPIAALRNVELTYDLCL